MSADAFPHSLNGLIDAKGLARELGVSLSTVRSWRNRDADWMPSPIGELSGPVWDVSDLEGIKERIPSGVGRPSRQDLVRRADSKLPKEVRRSRGVYYTPEDAAHFMARWLVRDTGRTYLEPSIGDGVFLRAVNDVEKSIGGEAVTWIAAELDPHVASKAIQNRHLQEHEIHVGDFLALESRPVDGAIANPPYVRLRSLDGESRTRALKVSEEVLGEKMRPSGSLWMPFVLHMAESIKVGGRLAVVLPLDLTYVAYAQPLWKYLGKNFGNLRVLRSRKRIFSDINQDVLILLASAKGGSTKTVRYEAYESLDQMVRKDAPLGGTVSIDSILAGERVFQRALLPVGLHSLYEEALETGRIVPASKMATFHIGYVAGDKSYFHPSSDTVNKYQLPPKSLHKSLINARRIRGEGLRTTAFDRDKADLLWEPQDDLTPGERKYVKHGEQLGVHRGYKAQRRIPWYKVPGVETPDAIITVFSEQPLLVINDDEWTASNSLLCAYMQEGSTAEELAASWYTPLTLLGVELEVHSLGGGVVVMVPREAARLPLLAPSYATRNLSKIEAELKVGDISGAYATGALALRDTLGKEGEDLIMQSLDALSHWKAS